MALARRVKMRGKTFPELREKITPAFDRIVLSTKAKNMISSLYRFDPIRRRAAVKRVKSSVVDSSAIERIPDSDAFVARAGNMQVVFRKEGDAVVVTSVVVRDR